MGIERAARFAGRKMAQLTGNDPAKLLFRGEDQLFLDALATCSFYGEYGCGASTLWCANNSSVPILSVDTSADWIDHVREGAKRIAGLKMIHVDLGELGEWGRPIDYTRRAQFGDYINAPWTFAVKPDLILVDGRFRVACFLQSLINAAPGATILFDDYTQRPHYHVIEEFVERDASLGTMARFIVPTELDRPAIAREIEAFRYVLD